MRHSGNHNHEYSQQSMPPILSPEPPTVSRVRQFISEGKRCCHRDCVRRFWESLRDDVHEFGHTVASCSHEVKEAALLMNLRDHLYDGPSCRTGRPRQRTRVAYSIPPFGRMCRCAYLVLWNIGESTLRALLTYMASHANSFCPRLHGLSGTSSNHVLSTALQQQVIQCILEIGDQFGEDDEGRHSRRDLHHVEGRVVKFLPATYTIIGLYRLFLAQTGQGLSAEEHSEPPVSFSAFRALFLSEPCRHIRIRPPRSNVCDDCMMFRAAYRTALAREVQATSPAEEEHVTQWQRHVQLAREAREVYNADLRRACETRTLVQQGKLPLAGYVAHYTFDFMQSLAIPQFADQTKNMYYFSLRNIHLFSLRDDGAKIQYNYVYDEAEGGKGANYVISLLFHFLRHRPHDAAAIVLHLHADNCCGQNKNRHSAHMKK